MRNRNLWILNILVWGLLCVSAPLVAGPLDRTDMGPRVNPATNDMLRVPGVVGMDYQSAVGALQQAGLNPRVNKLHKKTKEYAGEEGMVVKQVPSAGGAAMLGSSVSITVYLPGNMALGQGHLPAGGAPAPYPDDGSGGYGSPGADPAADGQGDSPNEGDASGGGADQFGSGTWGEPATAPAASTAPGVGTNGPSVPPTRWQVPPAGDPAGTTAAPSVPVKPEGEHYLHNPQQSGQLR
ncbi:MAG: PASTA domain-containing protein [Gammaproteobacteria bacterium]